MKHSHQYKAFISYSHQDEKWARWLHKGLETYRIPKHVVRQHGLGSNRLIPIFRDREELASSGDLSTTIQQALSDSESLVVICSPAASESRWVNEEIKHFKQMGKADRVYCLLVDNPDLSFPPAALIDVDGDGFATVGETEPLAADARKEGDGKNGAKLKLIAGLLDVSLDDLRQRETQRRQKRLIGVTAASSLGMIVMVALTVLATQARFEADAQRLIAESERLQAEVEAETSRQVTDFLVDLFELSSPEAEAGRKLTAEEILARGSDRIERELADAPVVRARLLSTMGKVYTNMYYLAEAKDHLDRALASQRELLDESDNDLLKTLVNRAWLAVESEDYELAEELYDEILPPLDDIAAMEFPDEPLWGDVLNHYGVLQWSLGNYLLAIEVLEKSLEMGEARYGLVHRKLVFPLSNLALAKTDAGIGDDARADYERAIEITEELSGPNHPSLVNLLVNMSHQVNITGEGDRHQSYQYQKRALAISIDAYGENNKVTAHVHRVLGITISYFVRDAENEIEQQQYFQEAKFHLNKAQDIYEQNEGSRSFLAESLRFKARVNNYMGEHAAAVDLYELVVATDAKYSTFPFFLQEWARALEDSGDLSAAVAKWDLTIETLSAYDPLKRSWVSVIRERYEEFQARMTDRLSKAESFKDQKSP